MGEYNPDQSAPDQSARKSSSGIPAWLFAVLTIALLTLLGMGVRYCLYGNLNAIHGLFSLFFSTNLLICYWEMCLFFRRDYIEKRAEHWRERRRETGRIPAPEFLTARVPARRLFSPTVWADVWAAYSTIDPAYSDRRTFGFNVDIANGFFTPVPTLILYAAYTAGFLPAVVAGIIGAMLFWQWTYVSSLYWVSFFVSGSHTRIARGEFYIYVGATNAFWVVCPLLGLYVSARLILDGGYSVLGF